MEARSPYDGGVNGIIFYSQWCGSEEEELLSVSCFYVLFFVLFCSVRPNERAPFYEGPPFYTLIFTRKSRRGSFINEGPPKQRTTPLFYTLPINVSVVDVAVGCCCCCSWLPFRMHHFLFFFLLPLKEITV